MRIAAITALALSPALAGAAPATAQIRDPAGSNAGWSMPRPALPGVGPDLRQVDRSIRNGRKAGQLSRSEARQLRREERRIAAVEARLARDGLSESEREGLQRQVEALRSVTSARRGR
ncbi:hypothetical protein [Sphingomonas sp.]|uniref:hypothetical protein n=1 Tax=Sphingomonas sp. TaxID=28214 RepID=UPI001EC2A10C|nr:hypothetical protein [Sphingomonas sp.]MBX3594770.1 hypothetical protein [Sphingomonas sp.]